MTNPVNAGWQYGEAPPPDTDGHRLVVWQRGFIGVVIATGGFWRDERNRAPWGAGRPLGWWCHLL